MNKKIFNIAFVILAAAAISWSAYAAEQKVTENADYGYTFRLPASLERPTDVIRENDATLQFGLKGIGLTEESPMVSILTSTVGQSLEQLPADLTVWVESELSAFTNVNLTTTTLNGQPAVRATYIGGGVQGDINYTSTYVINPNGQFIYNIMKASLAESETLTVAYDKVIDSFRFR